MSRTGTTARPAPPKGARSSRSGSAARTSASDRVRAVPARVSASGETSMPTRIDLESLQSSLEAVRTASPQARQVKCERVLDAGAGAGRRGRLKGPANASGSSGRREGPPAGGLVQGRVGGDDRRRAAGERLDHRDAEALEARRVGEGGGAAIQARELVVRDEAEEADALGCERTVLPAFEPGEGERQLRPALRRR